ncbi:MAG: type II toxin-antitoxin system prevent-host-death family antitoxin [Spirulinaceae cyanobacterium RM2_2_10]|nr:type II toxin-antitoxin system prevent-host-death family antitoxin [Spirulinaceae cyanobacterium SM2_1_0]NJO19500.1 type II toxin-antitoxin system prevent-host-death family antitoxin [Spirulinaceae cyanobacterium RM2_2_10]
METPEQLAAIPGDRVDLAQLMRELATADKPVLITGEDSNAVLISEAQWRAIQETLYLLSIPGMRESIQTGLATAIEDCETELGW